MKTDGTNPPGQGIFGLIDINCHILPGTEDGPDNFREAAEMLRIAYDEGIRTIVANVEQYECLEEDEDKVEELIQFGAYVQISASAVVGDLGHDIKNFSRKLLKGELVHFVASDALDSEDKAPYLRECAEYIERKYGEDYMTELFYTNPKAVIENDDIDI